MTGGEAKAVVAASVVIEVVFVLAIFGLIVLCAGEPDLLDAIVANVKAGATCRP